jgi:hypothetical protein
MNDIVIIVIGICILILFIILCILLFYLYENYMKYNDDVNDKLYKSEQALNNTTKDIKQLQDNVINSNYNITTAPYKLNANLLNIMDITNNGIPVTNLISNSIDPSKSLQIKIKPEIITQSNLNICNNTTSNRKCLNINVDETGTFNVNTSNVANVSVRDISGKVMAVFDGANKKISLGSNIAPAIEITDNVYTPDVITCQYVYNKGDNVSHISFTFISNFNIKSSTFINLVLFEPFIVDIGKETTNYTNGSFDINNFLIKIKPINDIPKNTFKNWNIPVTYNDNYKRTYVSDLMPYPARTIAYITLS